MRTPQSSQTYSVTTTTVLGAVAEPTSRDELDGMGRRHDLPGGEFGPVFDYEFRGTAGTRR
jgi:hypothetical protein